LSDGEGTDIDHDLTELTANKTSSRPSSSLRKANGTKATRTRNNSKSLRKKSQIPTGAATKMLASQPLVVKDPTDGKTIGLFYCSSKQHQKNSNLTASMAISYDHYFSQIPCLDGDDE
jgi:hypothetical protein